MNLNKLSFRTIAPILGFVLLLAAQILTIVNENKLDKLSNRAFESQNITYVAEDEAKNIKPESWASVYLPSSLPDTYNLDVGTSTDNYISCGFYRTIDTGFADNIPHIYFTQWNSIKETIPTDGSKLPPILKTGKVQIGYEDESVKQLEVNINATLKPQTYNGKEYYFSEETPNDDLLLLWYDEDNTFALRFNPGKKNTSHKNITLDDMLKIADQVKEYS